MKRLYIRFKSLVNDFVYSFGRAALLLLVEVQNHTVPVRERGRIRVNKTIQVISRLLHNPPSTALFTRPYQDPDESGSHSHTSSFKHLFHFSPV